MNLRRTILNLVTTGALVALPAIAGAQTAPQFHVIDLTQILAGCAGTALNDSGTVAATCPDGVVRWQAGTLTRSGKLAGGAWASPTAINSFGTIVGDADPGNGRPNPFITFKGGLLNVDPISGGNARSVGVTDSGVIFGNMTKSLSGNTASWNVIMWTVDPGHPDRYKETLFPHYPGGDAKFNGVYATASNKAGQVVGWVTTTIIGQAGGFWNNDSKHSVVALQALPGSNYAIAVGVNDLGQAVGQSNTPVTDVHAVLWQNDAAHSVVDLGVLPGDAASGAQYINAAGQVVGFSSTGVFAGSSRTFFYQNGTMSDLASLIDPADGLWTVSAVYGLNNAGQVLALASGPTGSGTILLTPVAP